MNLTEYAAANAKPLNKCKLCKSPYRQEVEDGLAKGVKYQVIADWLNMKTGEINWYNTLKNHILAGHVGVER